LCDNRHLEYTEGYKNGFSYKGYKMLKKNILNLFLLLALCSTDNAWSSGSKEKKHHKKEKLSDEDLMDKLKQLENKLKNVDGQVNLLSDNNDIDAIKNNLKTLQTNYKAVQDDLDELIENPEYLDLRTRINTMKHEQSTDKTNTVRDSSAIAAFSWLFGGPLPLLTYGAYKSVAAFNNKTQDQETESNIDKIHKTYNAYKDSFTNLFVGKKEDITDQEVGAFLKKNYLTKTVGNNEVPTIAVNDLQGEEKTIIQKHLLNKKLLTRFVKSSIKFLEIATVIAVLCGSAWISEKYLIPASVQAKIALYENTVWTKTLTLLVNFYNSRIKPSIMNEVATLKLFNTKNKIIL
jgi:hypothetical protein